MTTITIDEARRDLLEYLRRVEAGETFLITRADQPIAEIKPAASASDAQRPFGLCAGEFTVPDDFDDPLPDEILDSFDAE